MCVMKMTIYPNPHPTPLSILPTISHLYIEQVALVVKISRFCGRQLLEMLQHTSGRYELLQHAAVLLISPRTAQVNSIVPRV